MADVLEFGRRPTLLAEAAEETGEALRSCPGINLKHDFDSDEPMLVKELAEAFGPVLEVWEGYSADPDTRYAGSSGGAAMALAAFALSEKEFGGVIHTRARKDKPYLNETVMSKTKADLLATTGSRYAPSSPCDGLSLIEQDSMPIVFIGKPCDVAAVKNATRNDRNLESKIGLTIAFFCAGTPSTKGTLDLLSKAGIKDLGSVIDIRYRGNGWPGNWKAKYIDHLGEQRSTQMTYAESWGFLQQYRQWRCYICPDHTGEFSDIAVGDPWYQDISEEEAGKSLIVARTKKGKYFLDEAAKAGYLILEKNDPTLLPRSQPNLIGARGSMWGRLIILKLLNAAVPNFSGFTFFQFWRQNLNYKEKIQSFSGTFRRVFRKKLNQKQKIEKSNSSKGHKT